MSAGNSGGAANALPKPLAPRSRQLFFARDA
jgi:hypothetical protein